MCLLALLLCAAPPTAYGTGTVVFDDRAPDRMVIRNEYYRLELSKANGAILALRDLSHGADLTLGSRGGCLWGAVFPETTPEYIGGCHYSSGWRNSFSYRWDDSSSTLTLTYTSDPSASRRLDVTIVVTAGTGHAVDLRAAVYNAWGSVLQNFILPSDLVFEVAAVQAGYGPFLLPGIRLKPSFFAEGRTYIPTYPSDAAFADYLALDVNGGNLAIYGVNPAPNPVQPVALGFLHWSGDPAEHVSAYHSLHTWVPAGANWVSPIVRLEAGLAPGDSILSYRGANEIDRYPSVAAKLGVRHQQTLQAPLIKADAWWVNKPLLQWIPDLDLLPRPSLLHLVAYQPRGHDENYPDFLPPDARWGTQADLAALVSAAQQRGILVMPYTNPTWWDDESPTMQRLSIQHVSMLDAARQPISEWYGSHFGYAVSPYVLAVQIRLASLMDQWRHEVPVDFVFEDQVGARVWRRDFNPAAPNPDAYSDGLLAHVAEYAGRGLMTEMGWDRLAAYEVAFHGSALTWVREFGYDAQYWGSANWEPYPLAGWLFHDKVLMYQHNLSLQTMAEDLEVLTWNMAFGQMLSSNWQWAANGGVNTPWVRLAGALQRAVTSRMADQLLTEYRQINANVMLSRFGDMTVIANWHPLLTYDVGGHRIAPNGFLAQSDDGTVLAGAFVDLFAERALSAGEHYLVVERSPTLVTVRQPVGADTVLAIDVPANWQPGQVLKVQAFDRSGRLLGAAPSWLDGHTVVFTYRADFGGVAVDHYEVKRQVLRHLPLILGSY